MTTEEFEKELRKLQKSLDMTEKDIQTILEQHRRRKAGGISIPPSARESREQ